MELDVSAILASVADTIPPLGDDTTDGGAGGGGGDAGGGVGEGGGGGDAAAGGERAGGVYELVAILMHSGTATGGHYRAFLRVDLAPRPPAGSEKGGEGGQMSGEGEGGGSDAKRAAEWYSFNDVSVLKVVEEGGGDGVWGTIAEMLREASGGEASVCLSSAV